MAWSLLAGADVDAMEEDIEKLTEERDKLLEQVAALTQRVKELEACLTIKPSA